MTQGGPPPPPDHSYMSGALPSHDYGDISPMQQEFRDPFPADARRSRQMDRDDLPQRISNMDTGFDEMYLERKPSRKRSVSVTRPSILRRSSTSTNIPEPVNLELWRIEKAGDDWTYANRKQIPASQKDLAKKAKSRSRNGTALDQMQKMGPNRLLQVDDLVEKMTRQTGLRWEAAWMEDFKAGVSRNNKKDVRSFDVIVARAGTNGPRPSLGNIRTNSMSMKSGERVVVKDRTNSKDNYDGEKKDKKDKDGGGGKQGGNKSKEVVDPDPFGNSKLFAPSGKPLEHDGGVPFDEVHLPPHIKEEEPIGRKVQKKRGGSRGAKSQHGDDPDEIVEVLEDDGAFKEGGAGEILNNMDFDNILPKGKGKSKKGRSRSRSKAATHARSRSRSKSRARAHSEHRSKGPERVDRYINEHDSVSSNGSGDTNYLVDEDDNTSFTSSSIHRDMAERGSLHRRGSSKHDKLPFREHYRGPQRERRGSREYFGEQIIVPHREPRRLSGYQSYQPAPRMKAIGYGDPWVSGQRSPDYPRSPSPRRPYGDNGLLYPHELREADERSEHYVDNYMRKDRFEEMRERDLDERERAVARKERALKRVNGGYGHVSDGRYR
jgi:hypothetical protein